MCGSFAVVPQTTRFMAETHQKLVRMEKSLKYDPIDGNVFYSKKTIQKLQKWIP